MNTDNITNVLHEIASHQPDKPAIIYESRRQLPIQWNFQQLDKLCSQYANGLRQSGIINGERVMILARPDEHFIPFFLGLLRAGMVPVLVDPGRPLYELLGCIRDAEPTVLIAPPFIQAASAFFPGAFGKVRKRIIPGGVYPGAVLLPTLALQKLPLEFSADTTGQSEAAIIFTTGSTGIPKGVIYTHALLYHQYQAIKNMLHISGQEISLFGFSAMMFLGLMTGVTSVVTESLNTSPNQVDVERLIELLQSYRVNITFASPLLGKRLVQHCQSRKLDLPWLRQLVVGGAPVHPDLIAALLELLPSGDVIVSLGSTEAMPAASISGRAALDKSQNPDNHAVGVCTGYPPPQHDLCIIPINDKAIPTWKETLRLSTGNIGEIIVRGPVVTGTYLNRPEQIVLAKIQDGNRTWHRMGDVGYLDEDGCLWFCGRKSQRVETASRTLFTIPCEAIFNRHPLVERSALVGVRIQERQTPIMVIEVKTGKFPETWSEKKTLAAELHSLAKGFPHTQDIYKFAFYPGTFPVDIRHNAKILREKLVKWVEKHPAVLIGETSSFGSLTE